MFIFLIPLLFDYALGGIYFIVSYRLAAEGYPAFLSGSPMIVWGISYALSSIVVGRITTPANARMLLLLSGVGTVVTSLCFILFDNVLMQLLWVALMGIVSAFYCIPFQVFAGSDSVSSRADKAAALYTFSWSIGTAAGCLGFGSLPEKWAYTVNVFIGVLMIFLASRASQPVKKNPENPAEETAYCDQMKSAWVFCGTAAFAMLMLNALLPWRGVELKLGQFWSGASLALLRFAQSFAALALINARKWMYGGKALGIAAVLGTGSMIFWTLGRGVFSYMTGAFLFGICAGIIYFSLVYYALAVPEKSAKYISINESLLGLAGIIGPAVGGAATQGFGAVRVFGGCACVLLAAGVIAQIVLVRELKFFQKEPQERG